ncbi:MAG TPA: tetratricopeptide repeat protein [Micropepsaceae bacterium]|nr:tetratricopeptide repeat protein [Micropepsaceae bacterium]
MMRRTTTILSSVLIVAAAAAGVLVAVSSGALDWLNRGGTRERSADVAGPASDTIYGDFLVAREAAASRDVHEAARRYLDALSRDPENNMLLQRAFLYAVQAGQMDTAANLARRVISGGQNTLTARLVLAAEAARRGDWPMARAEIDAMLATDQGISSRLISYWIMAGEGRGADARRELARASGQRGFDVLGDYHGALMAALLGDRTGADALFIRAVENSEGRSGRVLSAYAAFLEEAGSMDAARAVIDRGLGALPENQLLMVTRQRIGSGANLVWRVKTPVQGMAEALFNMATVFDTENGLDAPVIYLQVAMWLNPDLVSARLVLAELFEEGERYEDAIAIYQTVTRDEPLYVSALIAEAINLNRLERAEEAVALLNRAVDEGYTQSQLMMALGDIERDRKNWDAAAAAYSVAINAIATPEERHWLVFFARGIAYERGKRWAEAEADLRRSLELKPDQPAVLNYLGYSYVDRGKNMDEGTEMIRRAVELKPNDGFIIDSLGWAYYRRGDYATAVIHLERAIELAPQDPTINDHLGDVYWKVGREREARFQWQRALSLSPPEENIPAIREKLENGMAEAPRADAGGADAPPATP